MTETQGDKGVILSIVPLVNGKGADEVLYRMMKIHKQISRLHEESAMCTSELAALAKEGLIIDQRYLEQAQCYLDLASLIRQQVKHIESLF